MITDRNLQRDFVGKVFNINGEYRECASCTLEDGGAWIWLSTIEKDKCDKINFVINFEYTLSNLLTQVDNGEDINIEDYGYLIYHK